MRGRARTRSNSARPSPVAIASAAATSPPGVVAQRDLDLGRVAAPGLTGRDDRVEAPRRFGPPSARGAGPRSAAARSRPSVYGARNAALTRERVAPFARFLIGVRGGEARHPLERHRQLAFPPLRLVSVADHHHRDGAEHHHSRDNGDEEQQEPPPEQHRSTVAARNSRFSPRPGLRMRRGWALCRAGPSRPGRRRLQSPLSLRRRVRPAFRSSGAAGALRDPEPGDPVVGLERVLVDHGGDDRLGQLVAGRPRHRRWRIRH